MMKNDQKKCYLKNDKVEHENHTQIVFFGKITLVRSDELKLE